MPSISVLIKAHRVLFGVLSSSVPVLKCWCPSCEYICRWAAYQRAVKVLSLTEEPVHLKNLGVSIIRFQHFLSIRDWLAVYRRVWQWIIQCFKRITALIVFYFAYSDEEEWVLNEQEQTLVHTVQKPPFLHLWKCGLCPHTQTIQLLTRHLSTYWSLAMQGVTSLDRNFQIKELSVLIFLHKQTQTHTHTHARPHTPLLWFSVQGKKLGICFLRTPSIWIILENVDPHLG